LPSVILNTAYGYKKPAFDDEADVGHRALKILDISAYGILNHISWRMPSTSATLDYSNLLTKRS
jgi:hypothetical protein